MSPRNISKTIDEWLVDATSQLTQHDSSTPRLDCLILLEDITGRNRAQLLAHGDDRLSRSQLIKLNTFITQRKKGLPLAYIRGVANFYGRSFYVSQDVLVPRPETETMITMAVELGLIKPIIADIGSGSGCLGITLGLELPKATIFLYDISQTALHIAQKNAQLHKISAYYAVQDLLSNPHKQFDVLLANLPYVPDDYPINKAARYEPSLALFGGSDGLELYRRLWHQLAQRPLLQKPLHFFTESLPIQHAALQELARQAGYRCVAVQGLIQHFIAVIKTN